MANWDQLGTDGNVDDRRGMGGGFGLGSSLLTFGAVMILGFFGIMPTLDWWQSLCNLLE